MKKIYIVATFIKGKLQTYDSWFQWFKRDVQYCCNYIDKKFIYAKSEEEAIEKYKKYFFKGYTKFPITKGITSDNIDIWTDPRNITIIDEYAVIINDQNNATIEELKNNMIAIDFRDWWNEKKGDCYGNIS